jgi:4-amino-4-deoxy-L-arabinose transferase-like glycosyltransferase
MKANAADRLCYGSKYLLLIVAILYIVIYLTLAFVRLRYPFELEWHEGASVDQVRRILAGQALYARPSLAYVPFIYPPLYYYVSAAVAAVTGIGFLPLRLVSILASIGCLALVFGVVRKETRDAWAGLIAAGLFAAAYRVTGAWLDIARVDSLYLCLTLLTLFVLRFYASRKAAALAGLTAALALLSKQTAAMVLFPVGLYLLVLDWRRALISGAAFAVVLAVGAAILEYINGGWFSFFVLGLAPQQSIASGVRLGDFWRRNILPAAPIALLLAVIGVVPRWLSAARRTYAFYIAAGAGMLGASWYIMALHGAYDNDLLPAFAGLAILSGIGVHRVIEWGRTCKPASARAVEIAICMACLAQFALLRYDPREQMPAPRDMVTGQTLISAIARIPGEVWLPCHGYVTALAGKASYAHASAISDVVNAKQAGAGADLNLEIRQAVQERKFAAIVLDHGWSPKLFDIDKHYRKQATVFGDPKGFWTFTGARTRPETIYVPR